MLRMFSYLIRHLFFHIGEFLRHWYVRSFKMYLGWVVDRLGEMDYYVAWRETARHFFEPLYKDYSIIGRALGVIFRSARLAIGTAIYAVVFAVVIAVYVVWLLAPPYSLFRMIFG